SRRRRRCWRRRRRWSGCRSRSRRRREARRYVLFLVVLIRPLILVRKSFRVLFAPYISEVGILRYIDRDVADLSVGVVIPSQQALVAGPINFRNIGVGGCFRPFVAFYNRYVVLVVAVEIDAV